MSDSISRQVEPDNWGDKLGWKNSETNECFFDK